MIAFLVVIALCAALGVAAARIVYRRLGRARPDYALIERLEHDLLDYPMPPNERRGLPPTDAPGAVLRYKPIARGSYDKAEALQRAYRDAKRRDVITDVWSPSMFSEAEYLRQSQAADTRLKQQFERVREIAELKAQTERIRAKLDEHRPL